MTREEAITVQIGDILFSNRNKADDIIYFMFESFGNVSSGGTVIWMQGKAMFNDGIIRGYSIWSEYLCCSTDNYEIF